MTRRYLMVSVTGWRIRFTIVTTDRRMPLIER